MARFVLNGVPMVLDADETMRRLAGVRPEALREVGVLVGGVLYPVKQAFEVASGVSRSAYTSQTARRHLQALGFEIVVGTQAGRDPSTDSVTNAGRPLGGQTDLGRWPWEGAVQDLFASYLQEHAWAIQSMADTATRARGVDVMAEKGDRRLGAEVKGWPSEGYADARRRTELKATRPSTQAGHWFSQALCKAIMLLDSHPGHDSLMVLPDYPRYRVLADRTRSGREAARVHIVFVDQHGAVTADTWSP